MSESRLDLQPHLARLTRYARFLAQDRGRADDLVQDTVVRALEKTHLYHHDTNLRGWLMTIMHNEHVNAARRRIRSPVLVTDEALARIGCGETQTASVEVRELRRGVRRLPEEQRETFLLHWIHGFRYSEISTRLGLPLGTVQSRISRARKKLSALTETPHSGLGLAHCNEGRLEGRHEDGRDRLASGDPHFASPHHGSAFERA
jgi:RNA polymerase sigma-70 factor (ECF subfamily)